MKLRLAGLQQDSIVDGPGIRFSIYVQGCPHHCAGCHNPETHDPLSGYEINVSELLEIIEQSSGIDGITISGGEPFEQAASLAALVFEVLKRELNLVIYSGFTFEELIQKSFADQNVRYLLQAGWLLIDGPFKVNEQDYNLPFRGSRNQRLVDLPRSLALNEAVEWSSEMNRAVKPPGRGSKTG